MVTNDYAQFSHNCYKFQALRNYNKVNIHAVCKIVMPLQQLFPWAKLQQLYSQMDGVEVQACHTHQV